MKPQHIDYIVTAAVFMALSISIARADTLDGVLQSQGLRTHERADTIIEVPTRASLPPTGVRCRSSALGQTEGA